MDVPENEVEGPFNTLQNNLEAANAPVFSEPQQQTPKSSLASQMANNYVLPETGALFKFKLIVSEPRPSEEKGLMTEASSRAFLLTVNWVKSQPLFPRLPLNTQIAGLRSNWFHLFLLGLLELILTNTNETMLYELYKIWNEVKQLKDLLSDMLRLDLDYFEQAAFKVSLLFFPACYKEIGGKIVSSMETVQTSIKTEWESYLTRHGITKNKSRVDDAFKVLKKIIDMTIEDPLRTFCESYLANFDLIGTSIPSMITNEEAFACLIEMIDGEQFWTENNLEDILLEFINAEGALSTETPIPTILVS